MEKFLKIDIYTPNGKYLSCNADFLKVTSAVAVLGILPGHAPIVTTLEICKMTIRVDGKDVEYAIGGGVLNIKKDRSVTLLLNSIERADEIDVDRAQAAKERAEQRLNSAKEEVDVTRAKAALARALNRLSITKD